MIAAIYARKSTDQTSVSGEEKSVARQVEHARAYAKGKGWTVADGHVYVDDGISGAEFAGRPGYMRLLNALHANAPFDVLVVSELSRLGREQLETGYALKQLSQAGVRVWSYLENQEVLLDTPTDKFLMSAVSFAAEIEREKARQRTYDAMQRKASAGQVTGGAVFGYRNRDVMGGDGRRSHVEREIDKEQAAVVRRIFALCVKGYGKVAIAKQLNAEAAPAPRAQQGRPHAWAPSSVRAVLYRDLYRGEIVWNRTKKRDSWGIKHQQPRPESEWLRVPAPELRIVDEELWQAAHTRLAATRQTYLRTQGGRLWGRPPSGLAGKYLLTGLARCGVCGGGLEVRSRSHGRRREFFYSCSSFYRRGPEVCPNRYEIPMRSADAVVTETLLEELLTPDRLAVVLERLLARAAAERDTPNITRVDLERQLAEVERVLDRLTAAVAAGGDIPALIEAIKTQDVRRRPLQARLEELRRAPVSFDGALERRLRAAVEEWRAVLGRQVGQARQIVAKLLADRLTFTPECQEGRRGFRFQATGTVAKLVAGVIPDELASLRAVASPRGMELSYQPVFRGKWVDHRRVA